MTGLPAHLREALGYMSQVEEDAILASFRRQEQESRQFNFTSLEDLVTSPDGFGLVTATPLQRAICRLVEGRPLGDLLDHPDVLEALGVASGDKLVDLHGSPPRDFFLIAGIRTFKSTLAAAGAIWASQKVDLSMLSAGEVPRFPILSLTKDNASVVMGHLLGALQRPRLRHLRIPEPASAGERWREILKESSSDAVFSSWLWHPSGRPVDVSIVAGKRAGASAISRWLFGLCLDEAPRMLGAEDAVVNYSDTKKGARGRLLPGAQMWSIGSPYQPYGPVFDEVQEHWGEPTRQKVIVKAKGPSMNPIWWTPERCEELKREDPVTYQTDALAEFADVTETLFDQATINACTRKSPLYVPYTRTADYAAAMDPATRSNAWTLLICSRRGRQKRVVYNRQWQGTPIEPLSPKLVLREIKEDLALYHLDWVYSDQWSADAISDLAQEIGLKVVVEEWTEVEKTNCYLSLAKSMQAGYVEIPPDPQLHKDLKLTKRKPTNRGPSIQLTKTTDGRHCDYSPVLARTTRHWLDDMQMDELTPGSPEAIRAYADRLEEAELEAWRAKQDAPWWAKDPWRGEYEN